jgi:hypothetical protein
MFCLTAELRNDRKDFLSHFNIRSLTPQQAAGNALAFAVQESAKNTPGMRKMVLTNHIFKQDILGTGH